MGDSKNCNEAPKGQQQEVALKHVQKRKRRQDSQKQQSKPQTDYGDKQQKEVGKENQISTQPTKPEKLDSEIEEIAKKIREANEKKMVQVKKNPIFHNTQPPQTNATNEVLSEDWTSVQGQFGWAELSNTIMPYLTRSGEKYVSLRMADNKIFLKYRQLFSEEIRNCFKVNKLHVTKAEAGLLNEINCRHCDNFFGRQEFTTNDGIVTLNDIQEMYDFLDFCYTRLVEKNSAPHKRCGFIRIASQNCVPYVWYNSKEYVPLFYFEGECKYLEERSIEVRDWELAYLKLSCKVQGIRKALFDNDSMKVVELELVKKFFPPDTNFEWIWPTNCNVDSLIKNPSLRVVSSDKPTTVNNNQEAAAKKRTMCLKRKSPVLQKKAMQIKSTLHKVSSTTETPNTAQQTVAQNSTVYYNGVKPASIRLPPNTTKPTVPMNCQTPNSRSVWLNPYVSHVTSTTATTTSSNATPNVSIVNVVPCQRPNMVYVNKSLQDPPPLVSTTSGARPYKALPAVRAITPQDARSRVLQIPDVLYYNTNGNPYFLMRGQVEGKQLSYLNMEPYLPSIMLVTLENIATSFFGVSLDRLVNAVNVMRLDVFLPNKVQAKLLEQAKMYPTVGLIKHKDFVDHLPQIRYILTSS